MPEHPEKSSSYRVPIAIILLWLTVGVALIYGRIIKHDFLMTWDDRLYVVHNDAVKGFSWDHLRTIFTSFYVGNYAPLQILSYMLDFKLWALTAGGFLFTNILIHLLNGIMFFRLLMRLYAKRLLAAVAAALFLFHPVQVESVAWVSQRKNLLALLFFLLAWECYDRYRTADGNKRRAAYIISVCALTLAVLSKSVAVIFPAVILAYDYCNSSDRRPLRFSDKIPYVLISLAAAGITILSQAPAEDMWGAATGGGIAGFHGNSATTTLLTMLTVACRYLGMLIWPVGLSAAYAPTVHPAIDAAVIAATIVLATLAALSFRLFTVNRHLGFWPIYILIAFVPVSQIIPLVTMMNDRYLYFPMLGVAALAGSATSFLHQRLGRSGQTLLLVLITAIMTSLAVISFSRAGIWRNDITFGRDTVARCPTSDVAWEALGEAYYFAEQPMKTEAQHAFRQALALNPTSVLTLYNLGVLYVESGDDDKGFELLSRVVAIRNNHTAAWSVLGDILTRRQQYLPAELAYTKSLALQPGLQRSLEGMGNLAMLRGDLEQARSRYLAIASSGDADPEVAFRLACIESRALHPDEAIAWLERALQFGWRDCSRLQTSSDLSQIRKNPRFMTLVQKYCSGQDANNH